MFVAFVFVFLQYDAENKDKVIENKIETLCRK